MSAAERPLYASGADPAVGAGVMRAHAIRGAGWMMGLRWATRLLSLVSTAVLARLLTPSDFGLLAMAMLALALVAVFSVSGQDLALIRLGRPGREYFDTAFTTRAMTSVGLFFCALAVAPLAGRYFHSHKVEILVWLLSLRILLDGATNIGVVAFRIEFDFAKEFRYWIYRKLSDVVLGISCVLALRSFWGLAIAMVLSKVVDVGLSYAMHPYRPRLRLTKVREIWSFSSWMLLVWLGAQLARKADEYVVGATSSAAVMGAYNVGAEIAATPTIDLIQPVMRALYPVYSRLLGDPQRLRAAARLVIGASATVCLAAGPGVAGVAHEFTLILLGPQWRQASALVFWLGLGAVPIGMNFCIYSIMSVTDNARLTAATVWARLLFVPALIFAGASGGASAIAAVQALLGFLAMVADFFLLRLAVGLRLADLLACLYRPVAAALAMGFVLYLLDQTAAPSLIAGLVVKVAAGAVAYLATLLAIWLLAGRPDGIEALAFATAARLGGQWRRRRR